MRFIASADWQIGKQALFLPEEARARYAQARLDVIRRIGELAKEVRADFVVVGGDVFESNQLDRRILRRTCESLRNYPVPVFLLPGNHDALDASSLYRSVEWKQNCPEQVTVLEEAGLATTCDVEGGKVDLIAAPWFSKRPGRDLVRVAVEEASGSLEAGARPRNFRVVVGHGAVSGLSPDLDRGDSVDEEFLSAQIAEGHLDFVVLGDRHSTTEVAPGVWYPGTPEVTAERETDPGNVLIVDVSSPGKPPQVSVKHVGQWSLQALPFHLNSEEDLRSLESHLRSLPNKEVTGVKLALTGTLSLPQKALLDQIIHRQADLFARLEVWRSHTDLAVVATDPDLGDAGLTGFAAAAARELQSRVEHGGPDGEAAVDALGLLLRLSGEEA